MENATQLIKLRRSVRTYDSKTLDEGVKEQILTFANNIQNPFNIPVELKFLEAKEYGLVCPVVTGTELFVGGKIENTKNSLLAFGYSFEVFILYARSLELGTVWLGGTMNRSAFENAMELKENEIMPCATAIGYISGKLSLRDSMMRKTIKADERLSFEALFFDGSFDTPLTKEGAGCFAHPLDMVRLAPSAVNRQPWRVIVSDNSAHFYLKRNKGIEQPGKPDMQMIDIGIALCHFALTAKEKGLNIQFVQENPNLTLNNDVEYIASYVLK